MKDGFEECGMCAEARRVDPDVPFCEACQHNRDVIARLHAQGVMISGRPSAEGLNGARVVALEMAIKAVPQMGPHQQCEHAGVYYAWLSAKWWVCDAR